MSSKFDERLMFSRATRERLDIEARTASDIGAAPLPSWYAVKTLPGGSVIIERNYDPTVKIEGVATPDPPWHQMMWAEQQARLLNLECHHDGRWIVGFTHPPGFGELVRVQPRFDWRRAIKLWMDHEGDVAFTIDNIDRFEDIFRVAPLHFVEQAEQAWQKWKMLMRDVIDPKEHQLKNTAQMKERGYA